MTYNLLIDQRFAIDNELTIVQTTTLAACMTLPMWTNTITVDGIVWYQYSETKMVEDFPLLFGIPKRVYKNLKELADRGFIELCSFGKTKYLRFLPKCRTWNRKDNESENGLQDYSRKEKSENGLNNSPKTDYSESENGLNNSPKTDYSESENGLQDYIINNNNTNNTIKKEAKASKENSNEFSHDNSSQPKASAIFGFTPDLLDVRKQVIDKVDNYFEKLVFPFDSEDFKRNFYILMCQPKWRASQKSFSAIQANLNGLAKYPEEFALILVKESISKGWAALEYDSTPEKYEKWEKAKYSVKTVQQSKEEMQDMIKYINNDF